MKFYVCNDLGRGLPATGVLHVSSTCASVSGATRRPWEATPSEMAAAFTLCGVCTPRRVAEYEQAVQSTEPEQYGPGHHVVAVGEGGLIHAAVTAAERNRS